MREVRLKSKGTGLTKRITLCVDDELEQLWEFCMGGAEGVADDLRTYLRKRLPQIKRMIDEGSAS